MDCFELGMCNRCLGYSRKIVGATKGAQVFYQVIDKFGRRGHKRRGARVIAASSNPVLFAANLPSRLLRAGSSEESPVHFQQQSFGDGIALSHALDSEDHCVYVVQHFGGSDVSRFLMQTSDNLGVEESPGADLQALYP
jgi:hypothetical protein